MNNIKYFIETQGGKIPIIPINTEEFSLDDKIKMLRASLILNESDLKRAKSFYTKFLIRQEIAHLKRNIQKLEFEKYVGRKI